MNCIEMFQIIKAPCTFFLTNKKSLLNRNVVKIFKMKGTFKVVSLLCSCVVVQVWSWYPKCDTSKPYAYPIIPQNPLCSWVTSSWGSFHETPFGGLEKTWPSLSGGILLLASLCKLQSSTCYSIASVI